MNIQLQENLANYAHEAWSGWMKYMFSRMIKNEDGTYIIPKELVDRWQFQMGTFYNSLPENMKKLDRDEAIKMFNIFKDYMEK